CEAEADRHRTGAMKQLRLAGSVRRHPAQRGVQGVLVAAPQTQDGAVVQDHVVLVVAVAGQFADTGQVDDGRAVNALEAVTEQSALHIVHGLPQQVRLLRRVDGDVVAGRLYPHNVRHLEEVHPAMRFDHDAPLIQINLADGSEIRARLQAAAQPADLLQQLPEAPAVLLEFPVADLVTQALQTFLQARLTHRFEQIVYGVNVERLHRV